MCLRINQNLEAKPPYINDLISDTLNDPSDLSRLNDNLSFHYLSPIYSLTIISFFSLIVRLL